MTQTGRFEGLDYHSLTRPAGLVLRLRAIGRNGRLVLSAVLGVLMVLVPVVVGTALVASGAGIDGGVVACLVMLLAAGLYVVVQTLWMAGAGASLTTFAVANHLERLDGVAATHYRGSDFARGAYHVFQAVRTPGEAYVEVGERFANHPPSAEHERPVTYLRVRLAGRLPQDVDAARLLDAEIDGRLTGLLGRHRVEAEGLEVTVLGSRPLKPREPGRVAEAFALVAEIRQRAEALGEVAAETAPLLTPSGIPVPVLAEEEPPMRGRRPLVVVAWTLGLLIVLPLGFALVMSVLDDGVVGDYPAARALAWAGVAFLLAVVGWFARKALEPGRRARRAPAPDGSPRAEPSVAPD